MAARTRRGTKENGWSENVRDRIKTSMLANRLTDHALGKVDMSATQVTAALGVLRKVLPDLAATELSGEVAHPTVIRAPEVAADSKTWLNKYGPQQLEQDKPDQVN